jgi:acetate kinase
VRPGARILALNPGSSSLKAAVRTEDGPQPAASMLIERVGTEIDIATAVEQVADAVTQRGLDPEAVAHRVVHGGPHHLEPTIIDDALLADLRATIPLQAHSRRSSTPADTGPTYRTSRVSTPASFVSYLSGHGGCP